ncbi:MAG: acyl-protein synthetase [Gammaproteobacteria bacterium SHHR-1]
MDSTLFDHPIYGLAHTNKQALLLPELQRLTQHHARHCAEYANLLDAFGVDPDRPPQRLEDFFPLAARLFKSHRLKSILDGQVFKTLSSSGTSGQPSRIFLDRENAALQSKVLVRIMQHWLGKQRLPLLIADHAGVMADRQSFSARAAGIQGFSFLGRDPCHALKADMGCDLPALLAFVERYQDQPLLIFGFTYMVWQYLLPALEAHDIQLPQAILLHGGGWKKLQALAVDNAAFKARLAGRGIRRVHNYYGLVEQTGSVFVECEQGYLHAPLFTDVLVRDPLRGRICEPEETGALQLFSLLPTSYPGHVLLTEDLGQVLGEDDCPCGRQGRYFRVLGRIAQAEKRGCSDAY